jgi:hypothetical protein
MFLAKKFIFLGEKNKKLAQIFNYLGEKLVY